MKKLEILFVGILLFVGTIHGQTIRNGNFEQWNKLVYEYPAGYPFNAIVSNFHMLGTYPFNVEKSTDAYNGSYAVKLSTYIIGTDTLLGFIVNTNPNDNPWEWHGGFPITEKPTGISGYYKGNFASGDSAIMVINFTANGTTIGTYFYKIGTNASVYTPFSFTFNPPLPAVPDSIQIGFASSDVFSNNIQHGSWIILDGITLTGISSQPNGFNGNFENWITDSLITLKDWHVLSHPLCISRTSDAYQGNFAVRLTTISDNGNVNIGAIGNGYWVSTGSGWLPVGGSSYHRTKDTLVLAYKYFAQNNDSAMGTLIFKDASNAIQHVTHFYLTDNNSYTVVEFPYELSQTPDTFFIFIRSSTDWHNDLSYVGSTLYLDKIFLKSEANVGFPETAIQKNLRLYPNPAYDELHLVASETIREVHIYSLEGKLLESHVVNSNHAIIDVSHLPANSYFIKIFFNDMLWYKPFIKK